MLTTKNWRAAQALLALPVALGITLAGCTPAGPRALLEGERLLQEGRYPQAIDYLQKATRLLPGNAQAWNHLGLAYHHAGQPQSAVRAYEQARRTDLNLAIVRYNLGCLLLEQNDLPGAISELTAYTVLQRDSVDGWLKLGTTQLRARQGDAAERSFQNALRLQGNLAEAWNALGVIQTQRRRPKDALTCFNQAVQRQDHYAPALLNLGILQQFYLNNRSAALQYYEEYLALEPSTRDTAAVQEAVRQLKLELAPPPRHEHTNLVVAPQPSPATQVTTNTGRIARVATNVPPASLATNVALLVSAPVATNRPRPVLTNRLAAAESTTESKSLAPPSRPPASHPAEPNLVAEVRRLAPTNAAPAPGHMPPGTNAVARATPPTRPVEVVQLADEPVPKIAEDRAASPSETAAASKTNAVAEPDDGRALLVRSDEAASPPTREKRRIVDRLNPATWFRGKRRSPGAPTPMAGIASQEPVAQTDSTGTTPVPAAPAPIYQDRAYKYRSPAKPAPGDRAKAQKQFDRAMREHQDQRLADAIEDYRRAVKLDPSFYEAHYNLGLVAYQSKDWPLSLSAYETALSINPTSTSARYNFSLALEQASHLSAAAAELEKILEQSPDDARAHFSVASLYAEKLGRPDLARAHYRRVLELEPQHPKAAAIRFWLAANP